MSKIDPRQVINCTGRTMGYFTADDSLQFVFPVDPSVSVKTVIKEIEIAPGVLLQAEGLEVSGVLPQPKLGQFILVVPQMKEALKHRWDLITYDNLVKDDQGNVVGMKKIIL